jgi:hypothetical protein
MVDLSGGELFLVCFIAAAVLSSAWWPRLGDALAGLFAGPEPEEMSQNGSRGKGDSEGRPPASD